MDLKIPLIIDSRPPWFWVMIISREVMMQPCRHSFGGHVGLWWGPKSDDDDPRWSLGDCFVPFCFDGWRHRDVKINGAQDVDVRSTRTPRVQYYRYWSIAAQMMIDASPGHYSSDRDPRCPPVPAKLQYSVRNIWEVKRREMNHRNMRGEKGVVWKKEKSFAVGLSKLARLLMRFD